MIIGDLAPYLVVFDTGQGERQELINFLDTLSQVKNWFAFLPTAIIVVSDRTPHELAKLIHERFPNRWFLVTRVPPNQNNGWLNKPTWDFINEPKPSGRWP